MNKEQNNWDSLWELFEIIINSPQEKQAGILSDAEVSKEIKKELRQLLNAHYSKATVLDEKIRWNDKIEKVFKPPKEIHGYEIKEKLGEGGVGEVYLATKPEKDFNRKVAIKFATEGRYSKHILNSFNTELKVLLTLNHTNIERLYEGGITQENIPFLVVEYIEGLDIDKHCEKQKLNVTQRLKLFQKVCHAVDAVHRSLIVHRDIKAGNIMVGLDGEPKLLDFGLAKLNYKENQSNNSQTTLSNQMMTLAYASPEQIKAERVTTASDIYSLGVLLYLLLTGKLPFKVKNNQLIDAYRTITEKQAKRASKNTNKSAAIYKTEPKLSKVLSGDLEQIVAKAISKNPDNRYLSAAQFSDDIENYLTNRPVVAKKGSSFYRIGKFIQRHKISVMLSTLAIFSLVILSVSLFVQSNNLKKSLFEIKKEKKRVVEVTEFLKNIFKVSDPLLTDKKIVSVSELLDYSSEQLQSQFNDEEITKATLYLTLGNVYLNLSSLEQAEKMFIEAKELYKTIKNKQGLINVELSKIKLLQLQGKVKLALKNSAKLFNLRKGSEPLISAEIEALHGQNLFKVGQIRESEKTLKSSLNRYALILSEDHEKVADLSLQLGNVYWRLGDFEKVKGYYQKAHDINLKRHGKNNHRTLKSRSSLGVLALTQGDYSFALNHLKPVAEARLNKLGLTHILTAEAYNRLGVVYYETGDYKKAQNSLMLAKKAYINLGLNNSLKFAKTMNNLGLVEREKKLYEQAQNTFTEALKIEIDVLGDQHSDIASMYNNLGLVAADLGDFDKAMGLFKKAHDLIVKTSGDKDIGLGFSMTNMGRMLLQKKQINEATIWIEKALKLRQEKLGLENLNYIESLSALTEAHIQSMQMEKAKKALKKVISVREKQLPHQDWRIAEAKALYILTQLKKNNSTTDFSCYVKIVSNKLGENHYRTKLLISKQKRFKLNKRENSIDTDSCEYIMLKES